MKNNNTQLDKESLMKLRLGMINIINEMFDKDEPLTDFMLRLKETKIKAINKTFDDLTNEYDLLITKENLLFYGFYITNDNYFIEYEVPNETAIIRVNVFDNEKTAIVFYDKYADNVIRCSIFKNHNLKTIKDLSDLIFTLTKHKIKKQGL